MSLYLFALISALVFYSVAIKIPKRMTRQEIYSTSLFSLLVNVLVDVYLDMRLHLYTYFSPGIDFVVPIYFFAVFPPISTIFLNYFPFSRNFLVKLYYIVGWTCFSLLYEFLATRTEVLNYTGWHLWYSALVYPLAQTVQVLNLAMMRKFLRETSPVR